MKFKCALFVVKDIKASRKFYEEVLNQQLKYDFGENITFEGDFALQEKISFSGMTTIDCETIKNNANNSELYFETENLDQIIQQLDTSPFEIDYIHKTIEHSWGQRVIRFYDLDKHIVEVGESMETVVLRLIDQGYSIEETVKIAQHPIEFVEACIRQRE